MRTSPLVQQENEQVYLPKCLNYFFDKQVIDAKDVVKIFLALS